MKLLDIGELSRRMSVPPSALRYYEERGLIKSVARHGLRRQYDADALLQLALISLAKAAGFSLAEIAKMFGKDGKARISRTALRQKADEVGRQIGELTLLRNMLQHAAECPEASHLACPRFRKLMHVAQRRRGRRA